MNRPCFKCMIAKNKIQLDDDDNNKLGININ